MSSPKGSLPDLSRAKSGRACLPGAGAAGFPDPSRKLRTPCPAACALGQSDRAKVHRGLLKNPRAGAASDGTPGNLPGCAGSLAKAIALATQRARRIPAGGPKPPASACLPPGRRSRPPQAGAGLGRARGEGRAEPLRVGRGNAGRFPVRPSLGEKPGMSSRLARAYGSFSTPPIGPSPFGPRAQFLGAAGDDA
jgi:hypothetical protein